MSAQHSIVVANTLSLHGVVFGDDVTEQPQYPLMLSMSHCRPMVGPSDAITELHAEHLDEMQAASVGPASPSGVMGQVPPSPHRSTLASMGRQDGSPQHDDSSVLHDWVMHAPHDVALARPHVVVNWSPVGEPSTSKAHPASIATTEQTTSTTANHERFTLTEFYAERAPTPRDLASSLLIAL